MSLTWPPTRVAEWFARRARGDRSAAKTRSHREPRRSSAMCRGTSARCTVVRVACRTVARSSSQLRPEELGRSGLTVSSPAPPLSISLRFTAVLERRPCQSPCPLAIGVDMSRFPTSGHLASWAGMCPGNHESAGKHRGGRSRKGSKWRGRCWPRPPRRPGTPRAPTSAPSTGASPAATATPRPNKAVGHSILVACWHVLSKGVPYENLGADWFIRRRPDTHARRLARQIEPSASTSPSRPLPPDGSRGASLILRAAPRAAGARPVGGKPPEHSGQRHFPPHRPWSADHAEQNYESERGRADLGHGGPAVRSGRPSGRRRTQRSLDVGG